MDFYIYFITFFTKLIFKYNYCCVYLSRNQLQPQTFSNNHLAHVAIVIILDVSAYLRLRFKSFCLFKTVLKKPAALNEETIQKL